MCLVSIVAVLITDPIPAHRKKCIPPVRPKAFFEINMSKVKKPKNQNKGYRGNGYDYPPEQVPQINDIFR